MNIFVSILCQNKSTYTISINKRLKESGIDSSLIVDSEINNDLLRNINFTGFNRLPDEVTNSHYTKITAWEKSFYNIHINNLIDKYDYFYFIEEDVYTKDTNTIFDIISYFNTFNADLISKLILFKEEQPEWPWWNIDHSYEKLFNDPHRSFNPLCRLSKKLVSLIFEFQKHNNTFYFHEILFSSLCVDHHMIYHDYSYYPKINDYIGNIQYRPNILVKDILDSKIYHPVKHMKNLEVRIDK